MVVADSLQKRTTGIACFLVALACLQTYVAECQHSHSADIFQVNQLIEAGQKQQAPQNAIIIFKQAAAKSKEAGYKDGVAKAFLNIGDLYTNQGIYDSSVRYLELAHHYCKIIGNNSLIARYHNSIGIVHYYKGQYEISSKLFIKAIQEEESHDSASRLLVNIYNNLSNVYSKLQQFEIRLRYLDKAEKIARKKSYHNELSLVLSNKGETFSQQKKYPLADSVLQEALNLAINTRDESRQLICLMTLGDNLTEEGKTSQAIRYIRQSISLARDLNDQRSRIVGSYFLGRAYQKQSAYKKAAEAVSQAIYDAEKIGLKDLVTDAQFTLADIYKAMGNSDKALIYCQRGWELVDSISGVEKTKAINEMEIKYKTAEKDKQLAVSSLKLAKQQRDIANKNLLIGGISAGVLILSLVLIGLYRADRHKQRMQSQQIRTLQQEQEIGILKAMMHGEENERGRIARELHDGIGGMLSATMMRFMSIRHKHTALADTPEYEEVLTLLEDMGGEIRKTAHNLMPEVLLKQGLPEAVRAFCNHIQSNGLQIDVQSYGNFEDLSHDFKLSTYRIIQELVQNILKHAKASHVLVQLMKHEAVLSITIEDDGVGFDSNAIRNGIGLHNLQTRVHNQNGRFTLESEEGKGTSVYIEFDIVLAKEDSVSEV